MHAVSVSDKTAVFTFFRRAMLQTWIPSKRNGECSTIGEFDDETVIGDSNRLRQDSVGLKNQSIHPNSS